MGWGMANMWYDKYPGLPPGGSPLETLFVLVGLQRRQSDLMGTRALVQSIVGMHESSKTQDPAIEAFKEYCDKMFPFLDRAASSQKDDAHKQLEEFVKHRAKIALAPVYKQQADAAHKASRMRRLKLTPKTPGTA